MRPASFCGVVVYKPSFGLIDRTGVRPLADAFDTVGVFSRTVADAAGLAFLALSEEQFDLVVPDTHLTKPAVRALQDLLINPEIRQRLVEMGFAPAPLQEP